MINRLRQDLIRSYLDCDREGVHQVFAQAAAAGVGLATFATKVIEPSFETLGELWSRGEVALTQVFVAARAVDLEVAAVEARAAPLPSDAPKVVLGTLIDAHGLGARLLSVFLRMAGLQAVEIGSRLTPEELVDRALREQPQVVAVSCLMLHSAYRMREVSQLLQERAPGVRLVVGGAPFRIDHTLADRVGAESWAPDVISGVSVIKSLAAPRAAG
jgi:methanogenic corrinoid protein MtbC1